MTKAEKARQYFNVHTSLGKIKYPEPIEIPEDSDDKHLTHSKVLEAWNEQLEEARTKATFSISFLRNFKDVTPSFPWTPPMKSLVGPLPLSIYLK